MIYFTEYVDFCSWLDTKKERHLFPHTHHPVSLSPWSLEYVVVNDVMLLYLKMMMNCKPPNNFQYKVPNNNRYVTLECHRGLFLWLYIWWHNDFPPFLLFSQVAILRDLYRHIPLMYSRPLLIKVVYGILLYTPASVLSFVSWYFSENCFLSEA